MFFVFFILLTFCGGVLLTPDVTVRHLVGEPDYRAVKLRWEAVTRSGTPRSLLPPFQVRYCELQSWGTQRCRIQDVLLPTDHDTNELPSSQVAGIHDEDNGQLYSTDVEGLRMATTYSFEVRPKAVRREDRADDNSNNNVIIIPTKGFSARATQCLPHASEIEVSTGPHFAGRITVEASDGERCTVDGEPNNPQDTYVLQIDHKLCGSYVNETTVATYVIVQENLPILTHSTRRFLVLCSYQPETLTVRAGLSLPSGHSQHHGKGHGTSESFNPDQTFNSVRRSRQLRPARLQAEEIEQEETRTLYVNQDHVTPVAILTILSVVGICSIILITFRWRRMNSNLNIDTESINSDLSITTDIEETNSQHNSLSISDSLFRNNISVDILSEIPKIKPQNLC